MLPHHSQTPHSQVTDKKSLGKILSHALARFDRKGYFHHKAAFSSSSGHHSPSSQDPYPLLYRFQNCVVKVANPKETKEFLKIRSRIFGREYRGNLIKIKKDQDIYDNHAQQIILMNTHTRTILGGCRIIVSERCEDYYSHLEYDLHQFFEMPGKKLEISRVCVHTKYRSGLGVLLLWRGVLSYALKSEIAYVFGIPSLKSTSRSETEQFYRYCQEQGYTGPLLAHAREDFLNFTDHGPSASENSTFSKQRLPTLLNVYIKAGARICSTGAVDHDLRCIDFLTVLKMEDLHPRYRKISDV